MTVLFALIGALLLGLVLGLTYRGFVVLGDHRQLRILSERLETEQRMSASTSQAIAQMRAVVRDQLRRGA